MNIAIGKIGRSCYFNRKRWSIHAGDDSPLIFYKTLCEFYPQHNFYMIGMSDYQQCLKEGVKMPDNFHDLMGEFKNANRANLKKWCDDQTMWLRFVKYVKDLGIEFSFGILLQGPDMSTALPHVGVKQLRNPTEDCKIMQMASNYIAPITGLLNALKFPWIDVNEDIRYVPVRMRDLINDEICVLSQSNEVKRVKRISGYFEKSTTLREHDIVYKYAGIERMFLKDFIKRDFRDPEHIEVDNEVYKKDNKFIITVNDGGNRLELIEKWILNHNPSQIVYGKWSEESQAKHPGIFVATKISDMEPLMWRSKYTFVPAWFKKTSNFVTQKIWKMMYYGIIPFFDKNGYDTDHILNVPDFCRVESPEEMWKKIDALEKNPAAYRKLLGKIYDLMEDKYFNGEYIKEIFGPYIEEYANKAKEIN